MKGRAAMRITPRLVFGLAIIVLGVLFMLDNLDLLEAEEFLRYWPVVLIAVGLTKLFTGQSSAARGASFFWLLAGTLILFANLDYLNFKLLWPLLLVLLGGWIVLRGLAGGARASAGSSGEDAGASRSSAPDSTDSLSAFAMMAGVERKNTSKAFRGGEITAIMGGCEIDLRDASIAGDGAEIDVFAFWGGIEIIVPGDWTVVTTATPIMGGVEDTRRVVGTDPAKRLVVRGLAIMGGVEIRTDGSRKANR